jgi:hypothetical protein
LKRLHGNDGVRPKETVDVGVKAEACQATLDVSNRFSTVSGVVEPHGSVTG